MAEKLKDVFFQEPFYLALVDALKIEYSIFDSEVFLERIFDKHWDDRALKERVRHTTITIRDLLPDDYVQALSILRRVAPKMDSFGFENLIFSDFVEVYGLLDWEASLPALEQFTQHMSAEFAVRPFIQQDRDRMMAQMERWADHECDSVRRLASEGCRPRLPWGMALASLQANPTPILPILEKLKLDESEAVRRSVANNLNDISKDNPAVVLETLRKWVEDDCEEIRWISAHALRTLIKQGDREALELLGYLAHPEIAFKAFKLSNHKVTIGDSLDFSFEIHSTAEHTQNLMIDYVIYLMRANGKQTQKVFKLTKCELTQDEIKSIRKVHSFAPVSTRKYYPGAHAIEVQINGNRYGKLEFELV